MCFLLTPLRLKHKATPSKLSLAVNVFILEHASYLTNSLLMFTLTLLQKCQNAHFPFVGLEIDKVVFLGYLMIFIEQPCAGLLLYLSQIIA